jgi:NTP pyrophosphatase (non-canonical NTP hydrolase)
MPDRTTTVAELRDAWARFVAAREWNQFHSPKNLCMALACEAAELMEKFLWVDNAASHEIAKDAAMREQISDELADVAGVVFALCNALDIDLSDVVAAKMAKNELKYPADKVRGKYRLDPE